MSGRIRTIKPELLEDAITAGLSDSAFRVFVGMILLADDYGNLRAEVGYLEGQIYWKAIPEKSVEESCKELARPYGDSHETLVRFYNIRGQCYAHLNGWAKHQKVQHPGKPRVPGPPEKISGDSHETLTKVPETLTPDLRPPTSDHDPEQKGESETLAAAAPAFEDEPEERTGVRHISDRPPAPMRCELTGDHRAVYDAIRAEPKLSQVDAFDLAFHCKPVLDQRPVEWLLKAVRDAAGDTLPSEKPHFVQKRVRTYLEAAKGPRRQPQESKAPYHVDEPEEPLPRVTPEMRRANAERARAIFAGIGKGPPADPKTESELRDKAQADQRRLAEAELAASRKASGT